MRFGRWGEFHKTRDNSLLIKFCSFLIKFCSFLINFSSFLINFCSFLINFSSFLINFCSFSARLRILLALSGVSRLPAQHRQESHRPEICSSAPRTIRLRRSPRTRLPEDGPASNIRKVSRTSSLHQEADQ